MKKKILLALVMIVLIASSSFTVYHVITEQKARAKISALESSASIKYFTETDLQAYDGTDPTQPIYMGLEGYVYDVTAGSSFYAVGGDYHYLAGKDSTSDLAIFGGDIIKRKYPIIGKLTTTSRTPLSTPLN